MDILLHLGAHRCASTTFQSYLWNNRTKLAKQGLTCWTPKRTRDGLLCGLVRHPALISIKDERNAIRSIGRMRVEMARLRNGGQKALLISEENILGSMRNNILDTRLYSLLRERLMRFQPAFEGQKLTVALSIRSYEDYWASCLVNLVARGGVLPSVDLLDFLTTQPRRWRAMIRDIAAAFPQADIVVWPFERMADHPEAQLRAMWPQDFKGLENGDLWRNRGADLMRLNTILAMRGERPVKDGPIEAGTRWMPFDEDQRNVLRAEYRRDLTWLASGAEGLARYVDGRHGPTPDDTSGVHMLAHGIKNEIGSGRSTSAPHPDRADVTRTAQHAAVLFGGHNDGRQKGGAT
ncbi:hypothetical protein L0664_12760 [Octadecabacter sp. G9-8]|uniref:Sulfotransferase family protein n=1 Tax=Octadecabacter dasysiphoniae TaxID=2909341 RepID=A0ABS9CYR4_9RHOB|nr:hypothetical protein [Octadecabacter dasysiphoniae]MCF2871942.1 hypothetical protein [Octadecabacter dasysiphoniae]